MEIVNYRLFIDRLLNAAKRVSFAEGGCTVHTNETIWVMLEQWLRNLPEGEVDMLWEAMLQDELGEEQS